MAITSASAAKLEGIGTTLEGIDKKIDNHMLALDRHKQEDAGTALRVHDLEVQADAKDKKKSNMEIAFWTAVAGAGADLLLRLAEHLPNLLALFK
jgi:hypothetical protein